MPKYKIARALASAKHPLKDVPMPDGPTAAPLPTAGGPPMHMTMLHLSPTPLTSAKRSPLLKLVHQLLGSHLPARLSKKVEGLR